MAYDNELSGFVVLDLETCADPTAIACLDPVKAPGNIKDPAKIAAAIAEKTADRESKLALEADCCRIVCVGWQHEDGITRTVSGDEQAEPHMLALLWQQIGERIVIGFNSLAFDLPVLVRRSQILGVPFKMPNLDKYRSPHIDLMDRLTFNGRLSMRSLSFYCKRFNIPNSDQTSGADVAAMVAAGDYKAIEAHCHADVVKTALLAERLGLFHPVESAVAF